MSHPRSDAAIQGSNGSTGQSRHEESLALQDKRLRMYIGDETFSISARVGGVGPSRSESDRIREYNSLSAAVSSLGNHQSTSGTKDSSGNAGS